MQKKKKAKNDKIFIFEKMLTMSFQICKKLKILNNLMCNLEKLKKVQISFDVLYASNLLKFLFKTCATRFLSKKAQNYQNLTNENRSKQRFSFLQETLSFRQCARFCT